MEDEMILNRPTDRRLVGDDSSLPPGPPGVENDSFELGSKQPKKENRDPRRRPPSISRERRSRSRSRGKRRSRSRGRDYSSPDRRRYGVASSNRGRRSRDRIIRSPPERSRDRVVRRFDRQERSRSRDRYRGGRRNTRSRSNSPPPSLQRRWSPMTNKPPSPALPPPPQYSVPPPQYETYDTYTNQYMGQFAAYDYANQVPVQVPYAAAYPCDPQVWTQPPPPQPTPPQPPQITPSEVDEDQLKRDAAIAQEAQNQRDQLKKQRSDYGKRAAALKRELKILKDQRSDLVSTKAPPSPTTKGFLDENDRLQNQIQKKLSTIENVIDMLSSIIGEEKPPSPPTPSKKTKKKSKNNSDPEDDDSSSPERLKTKLIESMKTKRDVPRKSNDDSVDVKPEKIKDEFTAKSQTLKDTATTAKKINYSFYDPEMHWCLTCDVFPKTAKDYLNHLHSHEHMENMITPDTPWHENLVSDEFPTHSNVATKRTPIRGLQFFVPSTGWYCKLCNFWMGDLHCASAHLKSRTHWDKYNEYIEQNPHFEVDWMADRQKVYDGVREKNKYPPPPPQITSVSTTGMDLLESIPLQINNQKVVLDLDKTAKKKKKKTEEKKEKKKKKRSKKRKKESSSSSSSSSDSSSESEKEKKLKEDRSNSIRVAMRNLLRNESKDGTKEEPGRGKWTTVQKGRIEETSTQPSQTVNQTTNKPEVDRKKDELISQWNTPQPIISASEKKLLEDLKGKLKTKSTTVDTKKSDPLDNKKRERSPVSKSNGNKEKLKRSRSRDRRSTSKNRTDNKRSKSRDRRSRSVDNGQRNRDRRSRSRDRGRGRMSPDRRRRRSRSQRRSRSPRRRSRSPSNRYGRRRSYSRSRSRSKSHRIEKAIVRYPEFRPRVPPAESKKSSKLKSENDSDRKKSPSAKKQSASQTGKKLPFIGRMPVFKKQTQGADGEKKEDEQAEEGMTEQMTMSYEQYESMGMMMDYDDLMPDPMQFVTLMGAPPPPPSGPPPVQHADEKDMLPPGIDESESDAVPKPISDAPVPRKGPLPKDFQEALNIIFPGERKPDEAPANKEVNKSIDNVEKEAPSKADIPIVEEMSIEATSIHTDDASQQSANEAFMGFAPTNMASVAYSDIAQDVPDLSLVVNAPPPPPPPLPLKSPEKDQQGQNKSDPIVRDDSNGGSDTQNCVSPKESINDRRQEELDDLAMLGIDADDLAAQCM